MPCRRRPGRRRCPGEIHAGFAEDPREITWICPRCGDNGLIQGWRGTRWDRSPGSTAPTRARVPHPAPDGGRWPLRICRDEPEPPRGVAPRETSEPPPMPVEEENAAIIAEFERRLVGVGLSPKTVDRHVQNVITSQ